ncbi:MAG: hypothetical protein CL942_08585 [Desulfovibrio sp.]|nr:hypothetical protein [Desulfovibrio sp.]|tara:strand:+ start:15821 stop:16291 length:471 start_codon:yes stop_codon:yes gene_type:complete
MPVIEKRMPCGIPGEVTRTHGAILEPGIVGASDVPHGDPVKLENDKLVPLANGDDAADIYGFMARHAPTQGGITTLTPGVAPAGSNCSVLRSGYMAAKLATGTAAKGDDVYVRVAPDTGKDVGDIEAGTATGNVAINAKFMGAADTDGSVEISYNI